MRIGSISHFKIMLKLIDSLVAAGFCTRTCQIQYDLQRPWCYKPTSQATDWNPDHATDDR